MSARKYLKQLGLLAGLALGGAVLAPESAAADDSPRDASLIVVQGLGEVHVRPDSLSVDVGVESRAPTVDQAREKVNATMHRVIDAVMCRVTPEPELIATALFDMGVTPRIRLL